MRYLDILRNVGVVSDPSGRGLVSRAWPARLVEGGVWGRDSTSYAYTSYPQPHPPGKGLRSRLGCALVS